MASSDSNKSQIYIGTMVFSIVAAIISVMLILFMVYGPPESKDYMYVVLTVEFGMLAVIINSIAQIYMYERDLKKMTQDISSNLVVVDTCPDYYTRVVDASGGASCSNQFVSPGTRDKYEVGWTSSNAVYHTSAGNLLIKDYTNKPLADVCAKFAPSQPLYSVPWTDLRAKCESYNLLS